MGFQGFGDIYLSASSQHPVGNDLSYGRKDSIALGLSHTTPHDKRFKEDDLLPAVEVTKPKNVARTRTKSESSRKPREKSKPAGTLQWVNISHPDGTSDPAIRKLVKRHARLVSHRGSKKVQSKPVARPSTPPSGGTVPFYGTGNFTIPVDSRSQFLFQHCKLIIFERS